MNRHPTRTAVIIGASSGIGEALAHELNRAGWRLGLLARRLERLEALRETLAPETVVRRLDVGHLDAAATLEHLFEELGGVDLVIISAGTGHNNHAMRWELDAETVTVNVLGFMAVAQVTMRHFLRRGRGHLVGISSIAALRGNACWGRVRGFESLSVGVSRWSSRYRGSQRTPYRCHRSPAGRCRHSHDETGPPATGGGQAAICRFSCKGSPTNPSSGSETEKACVHYEAVWAGRFHPQAPTASRMGKPAHRIRNPSPLAS